jgi:energy-coupling factor transport system permease protein
VVPVVMTSVEGSLQLAESMEARGFGSGPRTFLQPSRLQAKDWTLVAAAALAVMLFTASQIAGWAADWYPYPSLELPRLDIAPLIACGLLFAPVLVWRSRD